MVDTRQIERLNWALAAFARSSAALIRHDSFEDLALKICQAIVANDVYCLAIIGLSDNLPAKSVAIVARAGTAAGYADSLEIGWSDETEAGQGPTGHAIRTGKPHMISDSRTDPLFAPWRERAERFGLRSSITVPFGEPGRMSGILIVYASQPSAFGDEELSLFEKLAEEAQFARVIDRERARHKQAELDRQRSELLVHQERDFSKAVIDSLPGILYLYKKTGQFLRWNRNFQRVSGYSDAEIAKMHPEQFFHAADQHLVRARIAETFEIGESSVEAGFLAKDGSTTPYLFTGIAIKIEDQECLVGVGIDLTLRKRAEELARTAQADLLRIARVSMLGEFAAAISHELNQPLAAITTNTEASLRWLAHEPANTDEAARALQRIIRDAKRATDIIKQARASLMNGTLTFEHLELNEIITDVVGLTSYQQNLNNVDVQMELAPDLPEIMGDKTQIQQVLVNLILNGIDAMTASPHADRRLVIHTRQTPRGAICATVQDSGPGFDPSIAEQIFERFFTTKQGGIGLGLSISRSIIESHGGRLTARNAPPHGAIFELTLPPAPEGV